MRLNHSYEQKAAMRSIPWLAILSVTVTLGCSDSSTRPSGPGRVELTVSPTSVSYAGGAGVGGPICPLPYLSRWGPFTWTIRETNGGEVTITSFKYAVRTVAGVELANDEIVSGISADFTGTAAPSLRVPANTSFTSRQHFDCELRPTAVPIFQAELRLSPRVEQTKPELL